LREHQRLGAAVGEGGEQFERSAALGLRGDARHHDMYRITNTIQTTMSPIINRESVARRRGSERQA
jgi:hypothetical protein